MKKYLELIKTSIKIDIHYAKAFVMSLVIFPLFFLVNIALYTSIYKYGNIDTIQGYSLKQITWYYVAVYFVRIFNSDFTHYRISEKIMSGDLTNDLLRPITYFRLELMATIANRLVGVGFELIPAFVIFSLIDIPNFLSFFSLTKFFIVAIASLGLMFLLHYLIGLSAFYLKNNRFFLYIEYFACMFLGGAFVPLEFFPSWVRTILNFLPFKYVFYWPVQFFLNKEATQGLAPFLQIFAMQALWMIMLYISIKIFWKFAFRKFCAVGG